MILNKTFEMLVPNRSGDDPFFQAFLTECRHGNQQWEMYWFVHGMPTNTTGSWLPTTKAPECGSERCIQLCEGVWPQQRREGTSWEDRQESECHVCKAERARRCRLLAGPEDEQLNEEHFVKAPYVHHFNQVKYRTLIWRASNYARRLHLRLHWVQAVDRPVASEADVLKGVALARGREKWLLEHDKDKGGIMGLLPLILGMRVRFTETLAREHEIFKHARGEIVGWKLSDLDKIILNDASDTDHSGSLVQGRQEHSRLE
jgi:hypothetical protein